MIPVHANPRVPFEQLHQRLEATKPLHHAWGGARSGVWASDRGGTYCRRCGVLKGSPLYDMTWCRRNGG